MTLVELDNSTRPIKLKFNFQFTTFGLSTPPNLVLRASTFGNPFGLLLTLGLRPFGLACFGLWLCWLSLRPFGPSVLNLFQASAMSALFSPSCKARRDVVDLASPKSAKSCQDQEPWPRCRLLVGQFRRSVNRLCHKGCAHARNGSEPLCALCKHERQGSWRPGCY